jgi:hypothetical protein
MQYLVREIQSNSTGSQAMIFKTLPDVVKHLQKINSTERLVVGEQEETLSHLEGFLQQRLATVALHTELNKNRQWVITAFE